MPSSPPNPFTPHKSDPRPVAFTGSYFVYVSPAGMEESCGDLPCFRDVGIAISCWSFPSIKQRIRFLFTGQIWFTVIGSGHPPIALGIIKPVDQLKAR